MGCFWEDGRLLPVNGIPSDHLDKGWNNIAVSFFSEIPPIVRTVNWDSKVFSQYFNISKILIDIFVCSSKVWAVEWASDGEKPVDEADFALRERDTSLVESCWRFDFTKS